jgi:hypothetical protein
MAVANARWIALFVIGSTCSRDWYSMIALMEAAMAAAAGTQWALLYDARKLPEMVKI